MSNCKDNAINLVEEDEYKYRFYPRFTEAGIERVMGYGRDGFIIFSTARSVVVPYKNENNPELGYDFESRQSLFDGYVEFCEKHNLPVFNNSKTVEDGIKKRDSFDHLSSKEYLEERNSLCDSEFWAYLRKKENPYKYTPVLGKPLSRELGFIVYNNLCLYKNGEGSWDDLKNRALSWCEKYKTYSAQWV